MLLRKQRDKKESGQKVTIVLFGATGDLAKRKLLPGLYNILSTTPERFNLNIIAIGRRAFETSSYESLMEESIKKHSRRPFDKDKFECLSGALKYFKMDMGSQGDYPRLKAFLDELDNDGDRIYYLATSANFF